MAATRNDVDYWIKSAKEQGAKYIISVCDTWDYDDYPIYCKDKKELTEQYNAHNSVNMQKINEIIEIDGDNVKENLNFHFIK